MKSKQLGFITWRLLPLPILALVLFADGDLGATLASANGDGHTHFRYGHYSWVPTGGNTVDFTLQNAFRRDGYGGCINPVILAGVPCTGPGGFPGIGDVIEEGIGFTLFDPGDGSGAIGSPVGALLYVVTSIDPANNWLFGLALDPASLPAVDTTISHTYAAAGNYTAFTDSCCRISAVAGANAHINNPDGGYRVETLVNVGTGNSSPVSALPPIVLCPLSAVCTFGVPGADPDGDLLNFRLSTAAEASSVFPSSACLSTFCQPGAPGSGAPNAASISAAGLYTWDTTGATLGPAGTNTLYSTQVTIEDLDAAGSVKSKVAVDFLIQLVPCPPGGCVPPAFASPPTPTCGSTLTVNVGGTLSFTAQASDPNAGDTVTLNVVGLPVGATMTPALPTSGNPVSSTFSWTPTAGQAGTYVVTFNATSPDGGATCGITIVVTSIVQVDVDIKPGSFPNSIKLSNKGVIPVAILTDASFDATTVDPSIVCFGDAEAPAERDCTEAHSTGHIEDVDGDGDLDLVLHYETSQTGIDLGDTQACLTGFTFGGTPIEGCDSVQPL